MSLYTEAGIDEQAADIVRQFRHSLSEARGRQKPSKFDWRYLSGGYGRYLYAMTVLGRRFWWEALCRELEEYFLLEDDAPYPDEQVFFFSLGDASRCITDDTATATMNLRSIKAALGVSLEGLSYVGTVEPAYYTNIALNASRYGQRLVSWHAHGLVWDVTAEELKRRLRDARKAGHYRPVFQGQRATHFRVVPNARVNGPVGRTHLAQKLRYMSKVATKGYRVYKAERVTSDGEILPAFRQRKAVLRPGQAARLFHQLKRLHLDKLAMADGSGAGIVRRAKRRALRHMPVGLPAVRRP